MRLRLTALLYAALAGCAVAPAQRPAQLDERGECVEVFRRVDEAVRRAGVADGLAARVAGFPYLRVDRFLASYAREEMNDAQFAHWMGRMVALGREGYAVELGNLSIEHAERLAHALWSLDARYAWLRPAVAECTDRLAALDTADPGARAALSRAARVPDEYATWQRVAGLYWLTRVPFAAGVRRWQQETGAVFARAPDAAAPRGILRTYVPPEGWISREHLAALIARSSANPLGIPDPGRADLELLFRTFAPEFVVDTAGDADEPGELGWGEGATPGVITRRPVVYRRVSHARYEGRPLLQLNYSIWFPERPSTSEHDLLGGRLDGVLWRVTLAPDGTPWVYDSMHLCGCYHLFFPTARAVLRPQPETIEETAFMPYRLPQADAESRVVVRLASGTHYLERVGLAAPRARGGIEYIFAEDDTLRSQPLPQGGKRSMFRPDGIVPGSGRGERFWFWPMGVPEAGSMRQWGRHATAFVGRRHFDDPGLLERYFLLKDKSMEAPDRRR
jgi:hypothetical protein